MRKTWRIYLIMLLAGAWPQLGCHQLPGDKSVKDQTPTQQKAGDMKLELTAADIAQNWIARAEQLEREGKNTEAIALCEKMREPGNPQALHATRKIALLYDRSHDLDKAEQEYRRLLQQNPNDADSMVNLGNVYYRRAQFFAAERFFSDALKMKPEHATAWASLGMTLAQLEGRADDSVEAFAKVLPTKSEACCKVAFVMRLQRKPREAMQMYEAALRFEPGMPLASVELSKLRAQIAFDPPAPSGTMKRGTVEQVELPLPNFEGASRQMMPQRPTLPPVPDLDDEPRTK